MDLDESHLSRDMIVEMLSAYRLAADGRDQLVRAASRKGLTEVAIHIHSGLARSTVRRILARRDDG